MLHTFNIRDNPFDVARKKESELFFSNLQAHKNEMLLVALPSQAFLPVYCIQRKIYEDSVAGNIFYCCFKFVQNDLR